MSFTDSWIVLNCSIVGIPVYIRYQLPEYTKYACLFGDGVLSCVQLLHLTYDTMKEKRFTFRLPDTLREAVYKLAQAKGMSLSEFIRYVLNREVDKQ